MLLSVHLFSHSFQKETLVFNVSAVTLDPLAAGGDGEMLPKTRLENSSAPGL